MKWGVGLSPEPGAFMVEDSEAGEEDGRGFLVWVVP